MGWLKPLLAACVLASLASGARAEDDKSKEIDCSATTLKFSAPGYTVTCRDYSEATVSAGESTASVRLYTLDAVSRADVTFLDVVDDHILGNNRIYYTKRPLESDIEHYFSGKFTDWAPEADAQGYEMQRMSTRLDQGVAMQCIAFRRLGSPRWGGIGGVTVGIACSGEGLDHAYQALKALNAPG